MTKVRHLLPNRSRLRSAHTALSPGFNLLGQVLPKDFGDQYARSLDMLRIEVEESHGRATIRLEGALSGAWVEELRHCWWDTLACPEHVSVVLEAVSSVDEAGIALLEEMHSGGTILQGQGLMTNYILDQIQKSELDRAGRTV